MHSSSSRRLRSNVGLRLHSHLNKFMAQLLLLHWNGKKPINLNCQFPKGDASVKKGIHKSYMFCKYQAALVAKCRFYKYAVRRHHNCQLMSWVTKTLGCINASAGSNAIIWTTDQNWHSGYVPVNLLIVKWENRILHWCWSHNAQRGCAPSQTRLIIYYRCRLFWRVSNVKDNSFGSETTTSRWTPPYSLCRSKELYLSTWRTCTQS